MVSPEAFAHYRMPAERRPDRFTGPCFDKSCQSFTSAHTSTAFGMASGIASVLPVPGALALGAAATVGWSRMVKYDHYPADVFMGTVVGLLSGWLGRRILAEYRRQRTGYAAHPL